MLFVVNDVAATPESGGIYSVLEDFYDEVLENDKTNKWVFILSGKYFRETKNIKIKVIKNQKKWMSRFFFEFITGKKVINLLSPDVYISLQNTITMGVKANVKIVYLQQPLPFQTIKKFSFFRKKEIKMAVYQKIVGALIKYSIRKSSPYVIVQTKWMKDAVKKEHLVKDEQLFKCFPKLKISNRTSTHNTTNDNRLSSFFFPAALYVYKNHSVIIEACKILKNKYFVNNFEVLLTITKKEFEAKFDEIPTQLKFIGNIKREKVLDLYSRTVLLFPSYIETFGLPLLESANVKGNIIAAKTEFSLEILDGYEKAFFFEYNNPYELADIMLKFINNKVEYKKYDRKRKIKTDNLLHFIGENILEKNSKEL